jgi:hypothetical protein
MFWLGGWPLGVSKPSPETALLLRSGTLHDHVEATLGRYSDGRLVVNAPDAWVLLWQRGPWGLLPRLSRWHMRNTPGTFGQGLKMPRTDPDRLWRTCPMLVTASLRSVWQSGSQVATPP